MDRKELLVPDIWEEHCVECGAPACYVTCERFQMAPGGLCRRLKSGICLQKSEDGRERIVVDFLPWGKMELYWQGKMASRRVTSVIHGIFRATNSRLRALTSETVVRGLWRRVTRWFARKRGQPDVWHIRCASRDGTTLMVAVVDERNDEVLVRRLDVTPEMTDHKFILPRLGGKAFFRISSMDGTNSPVVFDCCEIVSSTCNVLANVNRDDSPARYVKCVAWDLDNTLWDGIISEVGIDGVSLKNDAVSLIKQLDSRGILNTICSKNDFDVAWPALQKFGISEYFVFPKINWLPKSANLVRVAKDMNIGVNAFAFIDDSFHERGEVSENLPCVRVFSEADVPSLIDMDEFNPPVSSESASRRKQYLTEMSRRKDEESYEGNHEEFLKKCKIVLVCEKINDEALLKRCWELVNRTNQLTLAARRYAEEAFQEIASKDGAYAIRCHDKYGDYGVVGFILFEKSGTDIAVSEFVMSCRVANKLCEQSVLLEFAKSYKRMGIERLLARVVETGRNGALVKAFDAIPFNKRIDADSLVYELDLRVADWSGIFQNYVSIG